MLARVLPIFFTDLHWYYDWVCHDGRGEVLCSQTAFVVLTCVAAMEIMATYSNGRPYHDILFRWFLKKSRSNFKGSWRAVCFGLVRKCASYGDYKYQRIWRDSAQVA